MALITPPASNATSYVSLADANAYFAGLPASFRTTWDAITGVGADATKEALLIAATRILESRMWKGVKAHAMADNALRWPRSGVYDPDGQLYPSDTVPDGVKFATAELAQLIQAGTVGISGAGSDAASALASITVGSIALTYEAGSSAGPAGFSSGFGDAVELHLAPFIEPRGPMAKLVRG